MNILLYYYKMNGEDKGILIFFGIVVFLIIGGLLFQRWESYFATRKYGKEFDKKIRLNNEKQKESKRQSD